MHDNKYDYVILFKLMIMYCNSLQQRSIIIIINKKVCKSHFIIIAAAVVTTAAGFLVIAWKVKNMVNHYNLLIINTLTFPRTFF